MSDPSLNDLRQQLEEALYCFICYNKVRDPKMCPTCNKLCCASCIVKWLTEHRSCPHCSCTLRFAELVNCPVASEISALLEKLSKSIECCEKCPDHNLQMLYFCKTCSSPICSDCAMFTATHKGHDFEKLVNMYEYHVKMLRTEESKMNIRMEELKDILGSLDENIERMKSVHEDKSQELVQVMEQMKAKLEAGFKAKMVPLIGQQRFVSKEIEQMQSLHGKAPEILTDLRQVNIEALGKVTFTPLSAEFASDLTPPYECEAFVIEEFSKYRNSSEVLYSDSLAFNGLNWRLKVYPNGNGVARGIYISLFLEMRSGLTGISKYEYRVEMTNRKDPHLAIVREFASDFESGECWGYNRFFRIDALKDEGYLDPEEDKIVLKFYVRAPTFYQHCRDQQRYIEYLESEKKRQVIHVSDLRTKLQTYESPSKALRLPSPPVIISAENPLEHIGDNMEVHSEDEAVKQVEAHETGEEEKTESAAIEHAKSVANALQSTDDLETMTRKLKLITKVRFQDRKSKNRLNESERSVENEASEEEDSVPASAPWQQDEDYCSSGSDLSELDISKPAQGDSQRQDEVV